MEPRVILPLLLFLVLAALFLLILRRASLLVAATRDHDRFTKAISDLDRRLAATLDPVVNKLDLIRRHEVGPEELAEVLSGATDDLRRQAEEARALRPPPELADVPSAFAREVERAERAVGLAEHGRSGLVANRGGPRELESQTSLKRAALNLRHAREAANTITHRVQTTLPPGMARARERRKAALAAEASASAARAAPPPARRRDGSDPSM
jgi:hypothetical protein